MIFVLFFIWFGGGTGEIEGRRRERDGRGGKGRGGNGKK